MKHRCATPAQVACTLLCYYITMPPAQIAMYFATHYPYSYPYLDPYPYPYP